MIAGAVTLRHLLRCIECVAATAPRPAFCGRDPIWEILAGLESRELSRLLDELGPEAVATGHTTFLRYALTIELGRRLR